MKFFLIEIITFLVCLLFIQQEAHQNLDPTAQIALANNKPGETGFLGQLLHLGLGVGKVKKSKALAAEKNLPEDYKIVYKGKKGPGKGKNIVFIASDHEYRSEESLPALARILAKHYGFTCTVIFGLDEEGYILPGSSDLVGLAALDQADLMVIFTRFSNFKSAEIQHINDYLEAGKPVIGLRTATHAFQIQENPEWAHYDFQYEGPKKEWKHGFGETILGETWVGHYGQNHKQASRLIIEKDAENHPIMTGVSDVLVQSGGYKAFPEEASTTVLARGQILNGLEASAAPDPTKEQMPVAWVRNYKLPSGASGRVFTTTHGASEDLLNDGFRRMMVNSAFWALQMEDEIKPDNNIEFVGPYQPTPFNFDGYKEHVKPEDLADWNSLIMPGEVVNVKDSKGK